MLCGMVLSGAASLFLFQVLGSLTELGMRVRQWPTRTGAGGLAFWPTRTGASELAF